MLLNCKKKAIFSKLNCALIKNWGKMSMNKQTYEDEERLDESSKPKNVPLRLWEKFKALEKRTDATVKRSTEKRIKHLQKTALENVSRALCDPGDREIVQIAATGEEPASPLPSSSSCPGAIVSRKRQAGSSASVPSCDKKSDGINSVVPADKRTETEREWREVRGLMGVNDHLAGVSHGALGPKTVLEMKVDAAIASGDMKTAEELSDRMASREFGEKVAHAIDARNFLQHKQEEEEMAKAKRRKKLHWGFEAKHRWETKSNM